MQKRVIHEDGEQNVSYIENIDDDALQNHIKAFFDSTEATRKHRNVCSIRTTHVKKDSSSSSRVSLYHGDLVT